jgi:putative chitinase
MVTQTQLKKISKGTPKAHLLEAVEFAANRYPVHVQAHIICQTMHESRGLELDREIWGPTAAQKGYEGRKDLGNTRKGDGSKFRGYGPIQTTGRDNVTRFYKWCKDQGLNPPDFTEKPELIATQPWAGWSIVWFWEVGNQTRKPLTVYADQNNIEMVTRKINGGLNGYDDRLDYYDRTALVLSGYGPTSVLAFQKAAKLKSIDGISGPQTRTALHLKLVGKTKGEIDREEVRAAPVVETVKKTEAVAVVPPSVDAPWWKSKETWTPLISSSGGAAVGGIAGMPWQNLALLVFAGLAITGVLLLLKRKDQKLVQAQVDAINAQPATTTVQ